MRVEQVKRLKELEKENTRMSWISCMICSLAGERLSIFDRIMAMLNLISGRFGMSFSIGGVLDTLMEAKVIVEGWRKGYNRFRPHSSKATGRRPPEAYEIEKFTQGLVH
jgi:hypothetical protein